MKKKNLFSKLVGRLALPLFSALTALPLAVAESSSSVACFIMIHQPKEPTDMAARLKVMKEGCGG
jgi:cyclic lactone autoinducer peptide